MFRRLTLESWHEFVPYLGFALISLAFLFIVIRAVSMRKSEVARLSHLPLKDDFTEEPETDDETDKSDETETSEEPPSPESKE